MNSNRKFLLGTGVFFVLAMIITGCCCPQHYCPSDNPPPLPDAPKFARPVRLALILGSGGARGLAHVGVLEEFVAAGIPIDLIVGCSAGSIVGALYADSLSTEHLKEVFLTLKPSYLTDFNIWTARYGLCQGKTLRRFLDKNLDADTFAQLKIPFYAVSTDLYSGELIALGGGPIVPAIEASAAIPFFFVPISLHGRVLVDGGVINPCPVCVAKWLGADIIVAVELCNLLPPRFPTNLFGVLERSAEIVFLWQSEECLREADVIVRPELGQIGCFDDGYQERIYLAGKEAARIAIPKVLASLKDREQELSTKQFQDKDR